jgi:hypothetical protein
MKRIIPFTFFILLTTIFPACKDKTEKKAPVVQQEEKMAPASEVDKPALVRSLTSLGLEHFQEWSYSNKGSSYAQYWYKTSNDDIIFSCLFLTMNGQEQISITNPGNFVDYLHLPLKMGDALTAKVERSDDSIIFTKLNIQTGSYEPAGVITGKKGADLYSDTGVFGSLKKLGTELNKLGVNEAQPYKGRIRFVMSDGLMISYLPDSLDEAFRKSETEGCKQIQPEWWYYVGGGK